jgi:hypothetical protein
MIYNLEWLKYEMKILRIKNKDFIGNDSEIE